MTEETRVRSVRDAIDAHQKVLPLAFVAAAVPRVQGNAQRSRSLV